MADFDSFRATFKGDIVTPADAAYPAAIARWALNAVRPAAVVAFVLCRRRRRLADVRLHARRRRRPRELGARPDAKRVVGRAQPRAPPRGGARRHGGPRRRDKAFDCADYLDYILYSPSWIPHYRSLRSFLINAAHASVCWCVDCCLTLSIVNVSPNLIFQPSG